MKKLEYVLTLAAIALAGLVIADELRAQNVPVSWLAAAPGSSDVPTCVAPKVPHWDGHAVICIARPAAAAATTPNGPQCTEPGWYKDPRQSWRFWNAEKAGDIIPSGLDAHSLGVYGSNGVIYWVCDQCRNLPNEKHCDLWPGLYKHPEDALAATFWAPYYDATAPQKIKQHGHDGDPAKYHGVSGGDQHYQLYTLAEMPDPPRQTYINAYACNQPTPLPTATVVPTPPPGPNQFAVFIETIYAAGVTGGCGGGKFCPERTITRGEMAVWLVKAAQNAAKLQALSPCMNTFTDVVCP